MNYNLAKRLQLAGFSQEGCSNVWILPDGSTDGEGVEDAVYLPSLSELILACGDAFHQLEYDRDAKTWQVSYWFDFLNDEGVGDRKFSAPEEAVAALWLALRYGDKKS